MAENVSTTGGNNQVNVSTTGGNNQVNVSTTGGNANVGTSNGLAQYYSDISKEWAIKMDGIVRNEDYSSKYWATISKENAQITTADVEKNTEISDTITQNYAQYSESLNSLAQEGVENLQAQENLSLNVITEREGAVIESITTANTNSLADISTAQNEALSAVSDSKTKSLEEIETTSSEILGDITNGIENIKQTEATAISDIENKSSSIQTDIETGLNKISDAETTALVNISSKETNIENAIDSGVTTINDTKDKALSEISTKETSIKSAIDNGVKSINDTKDTAVTEITTLQGNIETAITEGVTTLNNTKDTGVSAVNSAKTSGVSAVESAEKSALENISSTKAGITTAISEGITSINSTKDESLTKITSAQSTAITKIEELSETSLADISSAQSTALTEIETLRKTSVNDVTSAQSTAISAIETKAQAEKDSIKADVDTTTTNAQNAQKSAEEAQYWAEQSATGQVQADWEQTDTQSKAYIQNKPDLTLKADVSYVDTELSKKQDSSELAKVATSGKYSDLTGVPTIDTALSTTSTNAVQNKAVTTEVNKKADKATTLSGYGITDSYTKTEVDNKVATKQDTLTTAQSNATNSGITATKVSTYDGYATTIAGKADKATTLSGYGITNAYTKTEADNLLANKVDKISGKSLISDTEITRLASVTNYDDTAIKASIATKQDKLTAGTGIAISSDNVISNTQTSAEWGNIEGDITTQEDLVEYIKENGGSSLPLFSTILMDKVLSYEETKGYALQGTYVYKEAVAGSRYGYPDFVAKCIEEMNAGVATETTLGDSTVTMYVNSNGHQFYNISDKDTIDTWFNTYGIADFYGVDTENQRVFLPRNKYFMQLTVDTTKVNEMNEAGLPNIEGTLGTNNGSGGYLNNFTGAFSGDNAWYTNTYSLTSDKFSYTKYVTFDASLSNPIYGNSDTVQPPSSNKLLYYVVGNTEQESSITDVIDVTTTENDTTPLGTSKYMQGIQPNLSWLASNGQWNDGNMYLTFYNYYVTQIGQKFAGGYVKDSTDSYDDYDLVINQSDMTFRLPIYTGEEDIIDPNSVDIRSSITTTGDTWTALRKCAIDGACTGTTGSTWFEIVNRTQTSGECASYNGGWGRCCLSEINKGDLIQFYFGGTNFVLQNLNVHYYIGTGTLYFKVGNAVTNQELIDIGEVTNSLANKVDLDAQNLSNEGTSYISGLGMPSMKYDDLSVGSSGTTYVAPANGFFELSTLVSNKTTNCIGIMYSSQGGGFALGAPSYFRGGGIISVRKGDYITIDYQTNIQILTFKFVYAEGAQND